MTAYNISLAHLRRQRAIEHLRRCGPHAIAELLADVERRISGGPAITAALAEFVASKAPTVRAAADAAR